MYKHYYKEASSLPNVPAACEFHTIGETQMYFAFEVQNSCYEVYRLFDVPLLVSLPQDNNKRISHFTGIDGLLRNTVDWGLNKYCYSPTRTHMWLDLEMLSIFKDLLKNITHKLQRIHTLTHAHTKSHKTHAKTNLVSEVNIYLRV